MELLAPQVDEAVAQADVLGEFLLARDLHRQHFGGRLHDQFGDAQFDLAGRQFRVQRAFLAGDDRRR